MGQEISQQRDNVRAWLAHSEPTGASHPELPPGVLPSSSVSAAAMSIPGFIEASQSGASRSLSMVQEPKRSRAPLVLGALLLIGLLGAGGFMLTRSARTIGAVSGAPSEAVAPPVPVATASSAPPTGEPAATSPSAAALPPPTPASALGIAPPGPGAAGRAAAPQQRPRKKKASDDVDLRNPYR
jgi:hypothetical protein